MRNENIQFLLNKIFKAVPSDKNNSYDIYENLINDLLKEFILNLNGIDPSLRNKQITDALAYLERLASNGEIYNNLMRGLFEELTFTLESIDDFLSSKINVLVKFTQELFGAGMKSVKDYSFSDQVGNKFLTDAMIAKLIFEKEHAQANDVPLVA